MTVFAYRALDGTRHVVRGTVVAESPGQARESLRDRGLSVQRIVGQSSGSKGGLWQQVVRRWLEVKVVSFARELSTLLGVGIPLLEALDIVAGQYRGRFQSSLLMLRERVSGGVSLADAMREQPGVFDDLCVSLTEVGQNTGTLEAALERLAAFKNRSWQFRNKMMTALMYPCLVLVTAVVVCLFLMTVVVPNLLGTLLESGVEPPAITKVVMVISDLLLGWWWLLLGIGGGVLMGLNVAVRTPRGRGWWHRFQLRVPLVGPMMHKQGIGRIALVVSTLMRSGVVFLSALRIAGSTTRNLVLKQALEDCERSVCAGRDIAKSLEQTGVFPEPVVRVFAAGQQSGRLEEMLDRLAEDYERQVEVASNRLNAVLEPILIIGLALVVGFIAFATLMPILEAGDVW